MNNERILIVEDEKIIALDIQRRMERFGYSVVGMASDRQGAIEAAHRELPDMILMDIQLATDLTGGIEAAKAIRAELGIPSIFITAFADEQILEKAKEAEPYGYILKPFKEKELFTTIDIGLYKHRMEKRLHQQERLFSAILHTINDGILATGTDFTIQFMNPVAESITGLREADIVGRHAAEVLRLVDPHSQRSLLEDGAGLPTGDRPLFFKEAVVKGEDGRAVIVDGSITRIHEKENATDGFVIALRDVTEIKRMSETIDFQASHDILTGLSNREEFSLRLGELLRRTQDQEARHVLLVIDVDRFKAVNDTCGSIAGDELLRLVASHIQANISRRDLSCRLGGDEFAIILNDCGAENGVNVAKRLQEALQADKFVWQQSVFPVTLSVGVVPLGEGIVETHAALAAGDDACHLSKEEGGNRINVFSQEDQKFQKRRGEMAWIARINSAIEENRFVLYHQPIEPLDPKGGLGRKTEILIRLINEDGSIAPPGEFIPAAERYNLMPQLDRWVVRNSFSSYRVLADRGNPLAASRLSINLSGPSILDDSLVDEILEEARKNGVKPELVSFEITETSAIQNLGHATRFMSRLKDAGFTFALDDFGSGFSSFGYLKNLPVDYLKIDGSLVQGVEDSKVSYAMVESINNVGHVMGIRTIAEFVKNAGIMERCATIGVDYAQGYHIGAPKPYLSPS